MKTLQAIWRRITTTRLARALEGEILPHMRAQETELTRQRGEIERLSGEVTDLRAEITRQYAEVSRQRAEIDRLRAENRALLNSILGIAGVPPIVVADAHDGDTGSSVGAQHAVPGASAWRDVNSSAAPSAAPAAVPVATPRPKNAALVTPTRRRSWQQIHRTLEIAAAQKKQVHEDSLA